MMLCRIIPAGPIRRDPAEVLHDGSDGFLEVEGAEVDAADVGQVGGEDLLDHFGGEGYSVAFDGCVVGLWGSQSRQSNPIRADKP
jgi:hypothetical protein